VRTIDWCGDHIVIIDQTRLPDELTLLELRTVDELIAAIQRLAVRGAPALGVAGALGVALADKAGTADADAPRIKRARPTAVNLAWAVDQTMAAADRETRAKEILEADARTNRQVSERGADLVRRLTGKQRVRVLTHCNAGALACVEWGTALGVVRALHERDGVEEVFVDETRPLLQGSRLTAWELDRMGVRFRVVVDGAGPTVIARGMVDVVIVGADRIAANGDVANKIGTYPLALAAHRHGIPFVVAAPESTLDPETATGADIPVEERSGAEVVQRWDAFNPAFDVTPADLVTAVVTEAR
jgi:methylthioribose-1-phosphate isomerase